MQSAQHELGRAREHHVDYLRQLEEVEKLEDDVNRAEHDLQLVEAAQARLLASQAQQRLERAGQLAAKYPESPPAPDEGDSVAQASRLALDRWNNRPPPVDLTGPNAEEIQRELAHLPPVPDGDTTPHADVLRAKNNYLIARSGLERHQQSRPPGVVEVNAGGLTPEDVRDIAGELRLEEPVVDPLLQERVTRAQEKVDSFASREPRIEAARELSDVPLLLRPFVLVARLVITFIRSLLGRRRGTEDSAARLQALQELRDVEVELGDVRFQVNDIRRRKEAAKTKASDHGLSDDPEELSALALRLEQASQAALNFRRWGDQEDALKEEVSGAERVLAEALRARGIANPQPVEPVAQTPVGL